MVVTTYHNLDFAHSTSKSITTSITIAKPMIANTALATDNGIVSAGKWRAIIKQETSKCMFVASRSKLYLKLSLCCMPLEFIQQHNTYTSCGHLLMITTPKTALPMQYLLVVK